MPLRYRARRVMLAIGRRGTPRKLGVPGEASPHVIYNLLDPEQMRDRRVAVVGGGDSAIEAALSLVAAGASAVHLIHRRPTFDRARERNRVALHEAAAAGRLTLHLDTGVERIGEDHVVLADGATRIDTDDVLVSVGGILPTGLLHSAGASVTQHFGRPLGN